jgi:hypothetical protein
MRMLAKLCMHVTEARPQVMAQSAVLLRLIESGSEGVRCLLDPPVFESLEGPCYACMHAGLLLTHSVRYGRLVLLLLCSPVAPSLFCGQSEASEAPTVGCCSLKHR